MKREIYFFNFTELNKSNLLIVEQICVIGKLDEPKSVCAIVCV